MSSYHTALIYLSVFHVTNSVHTRRDGFGQLGKFSHTHTYIHHVPKNDSRHFSYNEANVN